MSDDRKELEDRLAKARAARAASEAKLAAVVERDELARRVEAEERAGRDADAIAAAIGDHGPLGTKIAAVETDLGVIIVKRSNPVLFKRFQDHGSTKTAELDKLVRPCLVYPTPDAFDRIVEELPATLSRVASAVCELAGIRSQEVQGKS